MVLSQRAPEGAGITAQLTAQAVHSSKTPRVSLKPSQRRLGSRPALEPALAAAGTATGRNPNPLSLSSAKTSPLRTLATSAPVSPPAIPQINGEDDLTCSTETPEACFGVGHEILGIDIGGTSIKAAPVDTRTGKLLADKFVLPTPQPATPANCAETLAQLAEHFKWQGAVGIGVPAVVKHGTTWTAANIDKAWIGADVEGLFSSRLGLPTTVVNDADAAGYAELGFGSGSGENERGVVFMVTFGTGIGTAMFVDGILVPNLELGHIELDGKEAEHAAAGVLVEKEKWTWQQWADKVTWYLSYIERLFWPTLFIVGGGVSNAHDKWLHLVKLPSQTPILAASMKNDAGIVGAAMAALARAAYDINKKPQQVEEYINA